MPTPSPADEDKSEVPTPTPADEDQSEAEINNAPRKLHNIKLEELLQDDPATGGSELEPDTTKPPKEGHTPLPLSCYSL